MDLTKNHLNWWNSCQDCHKRLHGENAWVCPWCFSCASRHFKIPESKSGEQCWKQMVAEIREKTLAPATIKTYQQGFYKAEWPLDSPFRIMAYLDKAPPSDASLKQWIAIANRIHDSRLWPRPDFNHVLVKDFISSIKRRPVPRKDTEKKATFNESELRALFNCLRGDKYPTDKRNLSIMIVQLYGVRRASEVLSLRASDVQIADGTFVIRGVSKKTDKRKAGIFFKLPHASSFGFDPAEIFADYILSLKGKGCIIFPNYDVNSKKFKDETISVNAWNRALKRVCMRASVKVATSHAIRRSAITLSPIELVEAVAKTGGWKSLCFWEVYRQFDIDQRVHAVSQIGKSIQQDKKKALIIL